MNISRKLAALWLFAVVALVFVIFGVQGARAQSGNNSIVLSNTAQTVLDLTNAERQKAGCAPLTANAQLLRAAQNHSNDMAYMDFVGHVSSYGATLGDRLRAVWYIYSVAGENVAAGQRTPEEVVQAWMQSPSHRDNILDCGFTEIGIGYKYLHSEWGEANYHYYWTQNFGRPRTLGWVTPNNSQ